MNQRKTEPKFWEREESILRYAKVKPQLFSAELNLIVPTALSFNNPFNKIKVLDLGCGGGRTTKVLYDMGFDVTAVDISQNLIKELKHMYPQIDAKVGDAKNLDFKDNSFDMVLFSHNSIDYLYPYENRQKAIREVNRVLKKDGYFIFSSHTVFFLPYNKPTFKNLYANFANFIKNAKEGYYIEQMGDGSKVLTYYTNTNQVKIELSKNDFLIIRSNQQLIDEPNLFKTFIKNLLAWETYYLAKKR